MPGTQVQNAQGIGSNTLKPPYHAAAYRGEEGHFYVYYSNPDGVSVHDGFPNPATDSALQAIDLNSLLIRHSASTYFMRIAGNDWAEQGIFAGDLAVIDRALEGRSNDLVIWIKDDLFVISPRHTLPKNAVLWGVVTAIIHQFRAARDEL